MVSVGEPVQENIAEKKSSTDSLSNEEQGIPRLSGDAEAVSNNDVSIIGLNKIAPSRFLKKHSLYSLLEAFCSRYFHPRVVDLRHSPPRDPPPMDRADVLRMVFHRHHC